MILRAFAKVVTTKGSAIQKYSLTNTSIRIIPIAERKK
jgi:hypothetical protein